MKKYNIYIFILLCGCNAPTITSDFSKKDSANVFVFNSEDIPTIRLPFILRADQFPGVMDSTNSPMWYGKANEPFSTFYGKFTRGDLTILIKNKQEIQSPILFTISKNGSTIDSLILLNKFCYIGTDSEYLPWIEINNNLEVIRTDTSFYSELQSNKNPMKNKIVEMRLKTDTTINIDKYSIDSTGKITKTK